MGLNKPKTKYSTPKWFIKKKTDQELMDSYSNFSLAGLMEKQKIENKAMQKESYSRISKLETRLAKLENRFQLAEQLLMKHLDETTDKRQSFKRWYSRRFK